jgi:hypothetical protein
MGIRVSECLALHRIYDGHGVAAEPNGTRSTVVYYLHNIYHTKHQLCFFVSIREFPTFYIAQRHISEPHVGYSHKLKSSAYEQYHA